jgi:hypothetical protein
MEQAYTTGDISTPLQWRCHDGHSFPGSPRLILSAGHCCPTCVRSSADYPRQAETNAFLRQLNTPAQTHPPTNLSAPVATA